MNTFRPLLFFRLKAQLPLTIDGGKTKWEIRNEIRGKEIDTKQIIPLVPCRSRIVDGRAEGMEFLARPGTTIYLIARKLIAAGQAEAMKADSTR